MRAAISEPRQGRKIVAQGVSPGSDGPHPAFGTPLPHGRERGRGKGSLADPRLTPWATLFRPHGGLTYSMNVWLRTLISNFQFPISNFPGFPGLS
jgi:hypothetical protein